MYSLAIDTASGVCAAAVHDSNGDVLLAEQAEDLGRGHAERLMDMVGAVLADASLDYSAIGRVIATTGPGSFTGIRVGLATARGIALGLGIEAVGVSSLLALAETCRAEGSWDGSSPILVVQDARRGEASCLLLDHARPDTGSGGHFLAPYHELARRLDVAGLSLCGTGAGHANAAAGTDLPVLHQLDTAPIAVVARLGSRLDPALARPEPVYIRPPDARVQDFAIARRV